MFEIVIIALYLGFASICDMRTREVPDTVSYSLIVLGVTLSLVKSIMVWNFSALLYSVIGGVAMFLLSVLLYYGGQWGGGDAKLLMGIGVWYGMSFATYPKLLTFLINLIFAGGIYGILYSFMLIGIHYKKIWPAYKKRLDEKRKVRTIIRLISFISLVTSFVIWKVLNHPFFILFFLLGALLFFGYYLSNLLKVLTEQIMIKKTDVNKLTEGDWIMDSVKKGKKVYFTPRNIGATLEDISLLKKLKKDKIVSFVRVKEGIPFIPSFLIAFILTEVFGNWFFAMLF
jgi:Flp pilus assembly protein protease CpaA